MNELDIKYTTLRWLNLQISIYIVFWHFSTDITQTKRMWLLLLDNFGSTIFATLYVTDITDSGYLKISCLPI